jgi:hypothetical protein
MNIKRAGELMGGFEFVLQLALIVGLGFGAVLLWPDDLFGQSMAAITFPEVLRAVSAPGLLLAAAVWLYLLVEPRRKNRAYEREPEAAAMVDDDKARPSSIDLADKSGPHITAPGYHSH